MSDHSGAFKTVGRGLQHPDIATAVTSSDCAVKHRHQIQSSDPQVPLLGCSPTLAASGIKQLIYSV
jgi:hypothetical protein